MKIVAAETGVDIERAAALVGGSLGPGDFETATWVIGLLGRSCSAADYAGAARYPQRWARQVGAFFADYDVLLTPTLAQPPLADRRAEADAGRGRAPRGGRPARRRAGSCA